MFWFEVQNGRAGYVGVSRLDMIAEQVKVYFKRRWCIEMMCRELKQRIWPLSANIGRADRNQIGLSFIVLVQKHQRRR